jgi:hypothetical protein
MNSSLHLAERRQFKTIQAWEYFFVLLRMTVIQTFALVATRFCGIVISAGSLPVGRLAQRLARLVYTE